LNLLDGRMPASRRTLFIMQILQELFRRPPGRFTPWGQLGGGIPNQTSVSLVLLSSTVAAASSSSSNSSNCTRNVALCWLVRPALYVRCRMCPGTLRRRYGRYKRHALISEHSPCENLRVKQGSCAQPVVSGGSMEQVCRYDGTYARAHRGSRSSRRHGRR
jgi:hypothetical protein